MTALTGDQVVQLVDAFMSVIDSSKMEMVLDKVDSDVRTTLSGLLFPTPATKSKIVSAEKNFETWNELWSQWHNVVEEVGDEEGAYIYQEEHWDPPSFDGCALAEDLEEPAKKMLPLLEEIYRTGKEERDLFIDELETIEHNIGLYPEWMGVDCDYFDLESVATLCLLKWEWLGAGSVADFLERLIQLEDRFQNLYLARDTVVDFITSMPEKVQKEMSEYIDKQHDHPLWKKRLNSSSSTWHLIYHAFTRKFDRQAYLSDCCNMLDQNWQYGLPLIEDLLKKEQDFQAEKVMVQTVSSFISRVNKQTWIPDKSLLVKELSLGCNFDSPRMEIVDVFQKWIELSRRLHQPEKTALLKIQLATYRQPYDWDAVAQVYGEVNHPSFQENVSKLIEQWQVFIVIGNVGSEKESQRCWIKWLLETGLNGTKNKRWFSQKVKAWLKRLDLNRANKIEYEQGPYSLTGGNLITFFYEIKSLFILTGDLFEIHEIKSHYPILYEVAVMTAKSGNSQREKSSRQSWLRKMEDEQLLAIITGFWKANVEKFIPDPVSAHNSVYERHARWLAAAKELNETAYKKILAQWKIDHKRRRNLWKAIDKKGLQV